MKYSKMLEKNRKINIQKKEIAIDCINNLLKNEQQVVVSDLVKKTGLSRAFFYNNKDVRDVLDKAQNLQKNHNFVKKQEVAINKALEKEVEILKQKLTQKEKEIEKLKKENKRWEKMVNAKELEIIKNL